MSDHFTLDETSFLRSQSYVELIANYHSRNPQPQFIKSANNFYKLYPNFDFEFYKDLQQLYSLSDLEVLNHYHIYGKYSKTTSNSNIKIVVYVPSKLSNVGGLNAMLRLAQQINKRQYPNIKACVYYYDHKKYYNTYCNNFISPYEIDNNTVVIYPETILGNPLSAKNIVRWILLDLGYEVPTNQYKEWSKKDLVYFWEPKISQKQLCIPWIEPSLLSSASASKKIRDACFMLRKCDVISKFKEYTTLQHPKNSTDLDQLSHQQIIKAFNDHEYFYSYDPNTFYNLIAPLCNCITILHPIPGISKEEYLLSRITSKYFSAGIAYGYEEEEIKRAKETLSLARSQMETMINFYNSSLDLFINDINGIFYNKKEMNNTVNNIFYRTNTFTQEILI